MESSSWSDAMVILSTVSRGKGESIARPLVEEHLVACVNILETRSLYRWNGTLEKENEDLLVIKTASRRVEAVMRRIRELHPYELPEMIAIPLVGGYEPYLHWVLSETLTEGE